MTQTFRLRGLGGRSPILNRPESREAPSFTAYPPRLLNAKAASAYLGLKSRQALGSLPIRPVRVGSRVLWDIRTIDAWLDEASGLAPSRKTNTEDDADAADKALDVWMKTRGLDS